MSEDFDDNDTNDFGDEYTDERPGYDDSESRRGCVLGDACLHHDPFHTAAECFDVEMAEHYQGNGSEEA